MSSLISDHHTIIEIIDRLIGSWIELQMRIIETDQIISVDKNLLDKIIKKNKELNWTIDEEQKVNLGVTLIWCFSVNKLDN